MQSSLDVCIYPDERFVDRHFRTATPVVRRKSSSSSSDSSTSDGGSEDGLESQYSMNLAPSAHYSTSLLRQTAGGQPLTGQVPSYLPSAQHSLIKPHPNQVVPALLIPPSNMSTTRRRDKSGLNRDGTSSPRKSAEDFGARRSSADFARGEDRVDDLGYHLEKLKLPKDKKKRHLTGLAPSSASVAAAPPLRPSQSASQLAVPPVNPNRAVSPTAKTQKRQPSGGVTDGGVLDLRTATLRSNAQRYGSASSNNYGYGTSFAPSRTYASGLSGTAMAHSRPAGSTLLVPPRMERIASSSSSISESSALPSPLANPAPPPELSRITSQESGVSGQPQGGNPGPEGNRFVPPPGRVARKTREMQEDYAMGVHGMRRQYESFKLDVRFGMLRTKKKMERVRHLSLNRYSWLDCADRAPFRL